MKRVYFLLFSLFLILSCAQNTVHVENPIRPLDEAEKHVVSGINDFAFLLFKKVNVEKQEKNVFISPMSVSVALAMTMNGARGKTFEAMQNTLSFQNLSILEINNSLREIIPMLLNADKNVKFEVGNSVWARQGVEFVDDFLNVLKIYYNAKYDVLDFNNPESKNIINKWVEEQTKGKIKEIIRHIPDYAVMYILNALYFKGNWKYTFDKNKTRDGDFAITNTNLVKAKFMMQTRDFHCFFNDEYSALRLPYGKGNFSMLIILPNIETNINNFISKFDRAKWENCLKNLKEVKNVLVYMPKFKDEFEMDLKDILAALGMEIAFTDFADFSGLCKTLRCMITDVKHKTFVQVDEEGTEAAAVTSVEIGYTSLKPEFYLTRPFVYVIYEQNTGAILFMGKLYNPTSN